MIYADVFIDGLTHYYDLYEEATIALRTNSSVVPYIILLDCSADKKDSSTMRLQSAGDIISIVALTGTNELSLVSSMNKCVLHAATGASNHDFTLSCKADIIPYNCVSVREGFTLQSFISDDMSQRIYIDLRGCEVTNLDDMLLSELDSLTLPYIDMYGLGTKLDTSIDSISSAFHIDDETEFSASLISDMGIDVSPPVTNFDDYLLTDLDSYTTEYLCEHNI